MHAVYLSVVMMIDKLYKNLRLRMVMMMMMEMSESDKLLMMIVMVSNLTKSIMCYSN